MSREIKFRAWDGIRMRFCDKGGYGDFIIEQGGVVKYKKYSHNDSSERDWPLMQYTGFTDVNLKEYFEGDLCSNNLGTNKETIREIRFEKGSWQAVRVKGNSRLPKSIPLYEWYGLNMPIVGNIHENPELLEPT